MLKFRKKLLISDLVLFLIIIACLFPFVEHTVGNIMQRSLDYRASHMIALFEEAPDVPSMIQIMKTEVEFTFQPVSLFDAKGGLIYDSILDRIAVQPQLFSEELRPEVDQAIQKGQGYAEGFSPIFQELFGYVARAFEKNGQHYILRTGFPLNEIRELTIDFELGFVLVGALMLLIYTLITWVIFHRLTRPIQQIIDTILLYKPGKEEFLPPILLNPSVEADEFSKLAFTLNSLTERVQAQIENLKIQKKETEGILEALGEGIIATDTSARVTFSNRAACLMLDLSHEALIGQSLDQIQGTSELAVKCHELILQALQTSQPIIQNWTQRAGDTCVLNLLSAPLAHQSGALLVLQDKTSDYKIVEMGKDFIANASHELRTPITIIRGFAETLQDHPEISQEMLQQITEKIVRTCGRLDKLVRSLLTLADIENLSQKRFRATDLISLVENCKHLLLTAHPNIDISIDCELSQAIVTADGDLLDLAIMNLFENAVKYSQSPAKIRILIEQQENQIHLSVSDCGIGISQVDLHHIFDRFFTVDKARSRKSGGAGLGLSIVKTIIEKHNGRLHAQSQLGAGSVFNIYLPIKSLAIR
ncbi:MAG: ATP-binding protein [Chlamydiota bacterium]